MLLPCVRRLQEIPEIAHVHLTRHWRFGPHLQIVVTAENHSDAIAALQGEHDRLLAESEPHHSTYELDVDPYLAMSEQLGAAELVPPPYGPVWPDNSMQLLAEPLEPGLIDNPEAKDLRDAFNEALLEPLEHIMTEAKQRPSARLQGAATLMILLAATYPDRGLIHGYLSYKSHLEDYMEDYDKDGAIRADFMRRYQPVTHAFEQLTTSLIADPTEPGEYQGDNPVLRRWSESLRKLWSSALRLAESKDINPLLHEGYMERARDLNNHLERKYAVGDDRDYSEFHEALRGIEYTDLVGGRWFASYRFMINLLYSQLLVLDISPAERIFLAHAISEAVQSVTGTTWRDILKPDENAEVS